MEDTIAAISTAVGEGGIGIVRVSGPRAREIAARVFHAKGGAPLVDQPSHTVRFGVVRGVDAGDVVDHALATVFLAPRSYTGEDTVEISTHGGPAPLGRTLSLLLRAGARLAGPGEFTQRAFVNGRLDLAQAEAVIDSIRARSDAALRVAVRQLEGVLSQRVNAAREGLLAVAAAIEASTDFPDDVPEPEREPLAGCLRAASDELDRLLATAESGRIYREGLTCAIVGRPNVGKSSLLNALLKDDRAIVTDIPGTTRDVLEESIRLNGVAIRLLDTAGLRHTTDVVERKGVERTHAAADAADILLVVLDGSQGLTTEDDHILEMARNRPVLVVLNKADRPAFLYPFDVDVRVPGLTVVRCSTITERGMKDVEEALAALATGGILPASEVTVSHARHRRSLEAAREALSAAMDTLRGEMPLDLVAQDVRAAVMHLGEIGGQTASDRVIEEIFSRFCIGK